MDNDNEPNNQEAAAKKPKQGRHTNTHTKQQKLKGTKKTDSGGSASNQSDMGSQTSGEASEWD